MTTCDHLKLVLEILLFYLRCKSICSEQKLPYNNSPQYSSYSEKYHKYIQYLSNYNLTLFNIYVDLIEEPVTLPLLLVGSSNEYPGWYFHIWVEFIFAHPDRCTLSVDLLGTSGGT
jgi:hypothetical protein